MEKGVKLDLISNLGIFVPKGTPSATVARIQSSIKTTMESDEFRQFAKQKNEAPSFGTASEFKRDIDTERDLMAKLVKEYGVKEKP